MPDITFHLDDDHYDIYKKKIKMEKKKEINAKIRKMFYKLLEQAVKK